MRYMLIGSGNTGNFETSCAILAKKVFAGEITTATAAYQEMRDLYPSDTEFQAAFTDKYEDNNQKAFYFLRNLEVEARRRSSGELGVEAEPVALTVEHILPKAPGPSWSKVLDGFGDLPAEDFVYRLGNMCLLGEVNRKLGTNSFDQKKKVFAKSDLITTKEVASFDDWGPLSISDRQVRMADLAVSAWRFQ